MSNPQKIKGRGAQLNTKNPFLKQGYALEHFEGIDELPDPDPGTVVQAEHSKSIVNKITSPDLPFMYSINPYQGCEHGCAYCYARNVHTYWGLSAGIDFERRIIYKPQAAELLADFFSKKSYSPSSISLSGNTDCYQPLEKKFQITRSLLEVFLKHKHPVGIITKNSLILRDIDILQELAKDNLVRVYISLTTLDESLRRIMEPRTSSSANRLKTIEHLSDGGIPVAVMTAPVIPGLNSDEIPQLLKAAADHGALRAGYTFVRLNGDVKEIFNDWLFKNKPDSRDKIWKLISSGHGGNVSDSRPGIRMRGEGQVAESIRQMFKLFERKYFKGRALPDLDYSKFIRSGQLKLF
ncbi:MAG: PA0069 family radical SAM protein [Bacteroidetes bacterium]|nr:PA0069 family radical SAM protein [Bacteroidota bacterium]